VVFYASLADGSLGIFTSSGGVVKTVTDTTSTFSLFGSPAISTNGTVAFFANVDTGGGGVFTINPQGGLATVADTAGGFTYLGSPVMNAQGQAVFYGGQDTGINGIFVGRDGTLTTIADTTGEFSSFQAYPAISNNGTVAFMAALKSGGFGIFTGSNSSTGKVITSGDQLFGSSVTFVSTFSQSINNSGQIAFYASLADGRSGVYVASPVPEASTLVLLATGLLALIIMRQPFRKTTV
jgi:hypothetical protein